MPESEAKAESVSECRSEISGSKLHGLQAGTECSNLGPGHVKSGSSEKSEHQDDESKASTYQEMPKESQDAAGPSNLHMAGTPKAVGIDDAGLPPTHPHSDDASEESDAVAAASTGLVNQRSSGPRRKTRRGRRVQKTQQQ